MPLAHYIFKSFGVLALEVFGEGVLPIEGADEDDALWRDRMTAQNFTPPTDALPEEIQQAAAACFAAPDARPDAFWLRAEFQVCRTARGGEKGACRGTERESVCAHVDVDHSLIYSPGPCVLLSSRPLHVSQDQYEKCT